MTPAYFDDRIAVNLRLAEPDAPVDQDLGSVAGESQRDRATDARGRARH